MLNSIINSIDKFNKSKYFCCVIDTLFFMCLIFQDISLRIFGTQLYKYIILIMLFLLILNYFITKRTIKISFTFIFLILILYIYSFLFGFDKNLLVPSIYLIFELSTFILYCGLFDNEEQLQKRFFKIIFVSAIVISILAVIQWISFKFNIKVVYNILTQHVFYLNEGRITSIYSEPAHLCSLLGGGIFVSLYYLVHESKLKLKYYLSLALLFLVSLLSGSFVTYVSVLIFVIAFYFCYFAMGLRKKCPSNKNIVIVSLILLVLLSLFIYIDKSKTISTIVDKSESFNESFEDSSETDDFDDTDSDTLKNKVLDEQLRNQSAFAMKSNFNIGLEKFKDGYYFGTGIFSHINFYDQYMKRIYPHGYIRINYTDGCSMFFRFFSELGIIGLLIVLSMLIYFGIKSLIKKDIFMLFILLLFFTQSMRLGEYNWVLNCFPFVYLVINTKFYSYGAKIIGKKKSNNGCNNSKKRILALTGVFLPHNETITQISYKILCNLDYDIDVVAFKSKSDKYFESYISKDKKFNKFHIHYIDVDWKDLDINSRNYNLFKIAKYIKLYSKRSVELSNIYDYDYVFSFSVPNYTHYAAYKVKKAMKSNIKWFASFSDPIKNNLYIEEMKNGKLKTRVLYYCLKFFSYNSMYEKVALNYSDYLIFICKELRDYVTKKDNHLLNKSLIYPITYDKNWINYKILSTMENNSNSSKIIFAHYGNIYGLRKVDKFIEALCELVRNSNTTIKNIEIHQYGDVDKSQISHFKNPLLKDILFLHKKVDYDEYIKMMRNTDVLLIFDTVTAKDAQQPFLPSKVVDYLLTNKPIFAVTSKNSPLYDIISKQHICVEYDVQSIKKGLLKQFKMRKKINNNIDKFDNDYVSYDLLHDYFDMIDIGSDKNNEK